MRSIPSIASFVGLVWFGLVWFGLVCGWRGRPHGVLIEACSEAERVFKAAAPHGDRQARIIAALVVVVVVVVVVVASG